MQPADAGWQLRCLASVLIAGTMAWHGLRKQSLSPSGAAAALVVGIVHMNCGISFGGTLILFYLTSSKLTKLQQTRKAALEEGFKQGGQRTATQVLSNSLGGCAAALLAKACQMSDPPATALGHLALAAFVAHYACCTGDTWASEVGILSRTAPRLITTLRPVPPGTNGGITAVGTACSAAAGCFIGVSFALLAAVSGDLSWLRPGKPQAAAMIVLPELLWQWLPLAMAAGLLGSIVDSLLGGTLQFSGISETTRKAVSRPGPQVRRICGMDVLNNDAVNAIAAAATSTAAALLVSAGNWHL